MYLFLTDTNKPLLVNKDKIMVWWRREYPLQMQALQCSIYFISDGGLWLQDVV